MLKPLLLQKTAEKAELVGEINDIFLSSSGNENECGVTHADVCQEMNARAEKIGI